LVIIGEGEEEEEEEEEEDNEEEEEEKRAEPKLSGDINADSDEKTAVLELEDSDLENSIT